MTGSTPPLDLAMEVDVTSKTQMDAYTHTRLGVPEGLWGRRKIYVLQAGEYQKSGSRPIFGILPILEGVTEVLAQSQTLGRSPALWVLRQKIRG